MLKRRLGNSELEVGPVALGCWPLAGVTSGSVDSETAVETIRAALDAGINHLDTAYAYGREGESERRIAEAIEGRRDEVVLATKVGIHWDENGNVSRCGKPETLLKHAEESLVRLKTDMIDLFYFHAPDETVPVAESAGAMRRLLDSGIARAIGVSNLSVSEAKEFEAECPIAACQPRFNMFQREIEPELLPWCRERGISVVAYEPLALGLLTGKFSADHRFAEGDWRMKSPLFEAEVFEQNLELVERLRPIAEALDCSLVQLVIAWTIQRPGITVAVCGAKRPEQIQETALSGELEIPEALLAEIDQIADQMSQ